MKKIGLLTNNFIKREELLLGLRNQYLVHEIEFNDKGIIGEEKNNNYDLYLIDYNLYEQHKKSLLCSKEKIIVLGIDKSNKNLIDLLKNGIADYIKFPFTFEEVELKINQSLNKINLKEDLFLQELNYEILDTHNKMASVINSMPYGIIFLNEKSNNENQNPEYSVELINSIVLRDFNFFSENEMVGKNFSEIFNGLEESYFYKILLFFSKNSLMILEREIFMKYQNLDAWYHCRFVRINNGISIVYHNISEYRDFTGEYRGSRPEVI